MHVLRFQIRLVLHPIQNIHQSRQQHARSQIGAIHRAQVAHRMVHDPSQNKIVEQYLEKLHNYYQYSNRDFAEPTFRQRYSHETDQDLWSS